MHRGGDFQTTRRAAGRDRVRHASVLLILLVAAARMPAAHGIERPADTLIAKEIQHYTKVVARIQGDFLSLIETDSDDASANEPRPVPNWIDGSGGSRSSASTLILR